MPLSRPHPLAQFSPRLPCGCCRLLHPSTSPSKAGPSTGRSSPDTTTDGQEESYGPNECALSQNPCPTLVACRCTHQVTRGNALTPHACTCTRRKASTDSQLHTWDTRFTQGSVCDPLLPLTLLEENPKLENISDSQPCPLASPGGHQRRAEAPKAGVQPPPPTTCPGPYLPTSHHGEGHLVPKVKFFKRKLHGSFQALRRGSQSARFPQGSSHSQPIQNPSGQ